MLSILYSPTLTSIHDSWEKHSLDITLLAMSLLFNMLSRLLMTFLLSSKYLLISWLQSASAVISEPPKIKFATVSTVSPSICYQIMGLDAMIFVFWMLSFKPTFSVSSFTFIKRLYFFNFCHKDGVFCISEFIDIPPDSLDSSLWFIQPGTLCSSSMYSCHLFLISSVLLGPCHFYLLFYTSLCEMFPCYLPFS